MLQAAGRVSARPRDTGLCDKSQDHFCCIYSYNINMTWHVHDAHGKGITDPTLRLHTHTGFNSLQCGNIFKHVIAL